MDTWQQLVQTGNEHFHNSAFEMAEMDYIHACEKIQKLIGQTIDPEIVNGAVSCYHGLAECLKCQGRYLTAMEVLLKVHQMMSDGLSCSGHCPQKRCALIEGRRKTMVELKYFQWIMRMSQDATMADVTSRLEIVPLAVSGKSQ